MVDIEDPKQHDETLEPTTMITSPSAEAQHDSLEELSKRIEVLLHASEAPLTAHALKKHLSLSTKVTSAEKSKTARSLS